MSVQQHALAVDQPRADAGEIDRSEDLVVMALGIDLEQVELCEVMPVEQLVQGRAPHAFGDPAHLSQNALRSAVSPRLAISPFSYRFHISVMRVACSEPSWESHSG